MNKKIGFVVSSTLFLIVVLSTPLTFAQAGYATCDVNVQAGDYYLFSGNSFSFEVITPQAGTPNTIIASDESHTYTIYCKCPEASE